VSRRTVAPEPKRRATDYTPAQLARQDRIGAEIRSVARSVHPERFAPDGSPLMGWPGRTWTERLASWHIVNDPEPDVPDDEATPAHADVESVESENDQPYERTREAGR
jgi:hypothetical protein